HKDWKMLRRYTNLRPEKLHDTARELRERAEENAKRRAGQVRTRRRTDILAEDFDPEPEQDTLRIGRKDKLRQRARMTALQDDDRPEPRTKRRKTDG
ncbi:MAG: hypothetical protein AB7O04_16345, partial [Hyphomonadaceae bacterium]